jgi:hypothetical protein
MATIRQTDHPKLNAQVERFDAKRKLQAEQVKSADHQIKTMPSHPMRPKLSDAVPSSQPINLKRSST